MNHAQRRHARRTQSEIERHQDRLRFYQRFATPYARQKAEQTQLAIDLLTAQLPSVPQRRSSVFINPLTGTMPTGL